MSQEEALLPRSPRGGRSIEPTAGTIERWRDAHRAALEASVCAARVALALQAPIAREPSLEDLRGAFAQLALAERALVDARASLEAATGAR